MIEFKSPVGRLVQGGLYTPNTTNMSGEPLVFKKGPKKGQSRVEYFFALAIPKKPQDQGHWANTDWGRKIWDEGHKAFPNHAPLPSFAWKMEDGDSTIANDKGSRPCDRIGHPGNWIMYLKGPEAPQIFDEKKMPIVDKDVVKLGYYVEVFVGVKGNDAQANPGVYLNPKFVCFRGFGERIILGTKVDEVAFGEEPLPIGASATPLGNTTPPVNDMAKALLPSPPQQPLSAPPSHPGILTPPVPAAPVTPPPAVATRARGMTPKAEFSYEEYRAAGWSDTQLIQNGLMSY